MKSCLKLKKVLTGCITEFEHLLSLLTYWIINLYVKFILIFLLFTLLFIISDIYIIVVIDSRLYVKDIQCFIQHLIYSSDSFIDFQNLTKIYQQHLVQIFKFETFWNSQVKLLSNKKMNKKIYSSVFVKFNFLYQNKWKSINYEKYASKCVLINIFTFYYPKKSPKMWSKIKMYILYSLFQKHTSNKYSQTG